MMVRRVAENNLSGPDVRLNVVSVQLIDRRVVVALELALTVHFRQLLGTPGFSQRRLASDTRRRLKEDVTRGKVANSLLAPAARLCLVELREDDPERGGLKK